MTKTALARQLNLTLRSITAFEAGEIEPAPDTVEAIASELRFPIAFFFGEDIEEPSVDGASFRALSTMTAAQRDMALASGALAIQLSQWIDAKFRLPEPNVPSMRGFEPEAAAQALRSHWGLGERPIRNVVHLLEASGMRVFSIPREGKAINAFSVWHREVPFVFLTTDKSGERGRFDAAHELGHLTLHQHGGPRSREAEVEADRFASAFLMPQSSVLACAPRSPALTTLIQLKKRWQVSVAALVHRLRSLRMLSEWQYRTLCIELAQCGYRTREPEGIQRETSQVLGKVFGSLSKEGVSRAAIARELLIEPAELDTLVFGLVIAAIPGGGAGRSGPGSGGTGRGQLRVV